MKNLLIVEDNRISGTLISAKISGALDFTIFWAKSMEEAVQILNKEDNNFFAALLDYVLPDAPKGEVIDEVVSRGIASIVFTATVTKEVREQLWQNHIVDYVVKDDTQSIEYLTFLLSRLEKNQNIKVLVVDRSKSFRNKLTELLKVQNYQVLEASDGVNAFKLAKQHPDIKLVITDSNMSNMDGFTLTRRLRKKYGREGIVILGVTSGRDKMMGAQFIKSGANDFIDKNNFITEEFYCRVNQNVESLESMQLVHKLATVDHLSGLYNRRYFYELATKLHSTANRNGSSLACAMVDIDHFKQINDNYGHNIGDQALKHLSNILTNYFQRTSDIVGRMGGEEFCILADNVKPEDSIKLFDELRRVIEASQFFLLDGRKLSITASIGVCTVTSENFDLMLNKADELLYIAKNQGRNRVVVDIQNNPN